MWSDKACPSFLAAASLVETLFSKQNYAFWVQCTNHMYAIRIHWHVKLNYKEYWRVKIFSFILNGGSKEKSKQHSEYEKLPKFWIGHPIRGDV